MLLVVCFQLSNEMQLSIMNKVKSGELSIEEALKQAKTDRKQLLERRSSTEEVTSGRGCGVDWHTSDSGGTIYSCLHLGCPHLTLRHVDYTVAEIRRTTPVLYKRQICDYKLVRIVITSCPACWISLKADPSLALFKFDEEFLRRKLVDCCW